MPLLMTACYSTAPQRQQLTSSNPLDKVLGAVWLAEAGDAQAVHSLVALLEDHDRTVRMYAILALERLCGQTYGYKYYEPEAQRAAAAARWREALRRGEVRLRSVRQVESGNAPAGRQFEATQPGGGTASSEGDSRTP